MGKSNFSDKSFSPLEIKAKDQNWPWWPLLPLYPYSRKRTVFKELITGLVWSLEQLQGLYYVAVPVRMTVVKINGGLMVYNPLPPTKELLEKLSSLISNHGPIKSIVLATASGLEHKISMPSIARCFPDAELWLCPGQWSFPLSLPLDWLGIPKSRTKILMEDGFPHHDCCDWLSLGPIDIGLGRFQEISCYHKTSKALLVTDALVGISSTPPELFDLDPTPILFHSRERGDEALLDSIALREKGWARLVLFASFLRPYSLSIPSLGSVVINSFKPGLRNLKSHFGIYPFSWTDSWTDSLDELLGKNEPLLQIAPVIERLIFPRSKRIFLEWLQSLKSLNGIKFLIPAHYNAPLKFSSREVKRFTRKITKRKWAPSHENWGFLYSIDKALLERGVVPIDPMSRFKG